jgi:hypothetical protein
MNIKIIREIRMPIEESIMAKLIPRGVKGLSKKMKLVEWHLGQAEFIPTK